MSPIWPGSMVLAVSAIASGALTYIPTRPSSLTAEKSTVAQSTSPRTAGVVSQGRRCMVTVLLTEQGKPLKGDIAHVVPIVGETIRFELLGSDTTDATGRAEIRFACDPKREQYGVVLAAGTEKDICCMVPRLANGSVPMFSCPEDAAAECGTYTFHAETFSLTIRE